jgi:hypothetical protein
MSARDELDALIREHVNFYDDDTDVAADKILAAGWRPPAQVIDTPEGLAALPTGTVIRSRDGDIASIDHGGVEEWTGRRTVLHLLDFVIGAGRLTIADLEDADAGGSFPYTVLYLPTEEADRG